MKVKILQGIVGKELNLRPGDQYEGDGEEMARWCAAGVAEPIQETREKAVRKPRRKAVKS
jgi:hypothetical protein